MRMTLTASSIFSLALAAPVSFGGLTIADIAPPDAVVVVGMDDFASMRKSFDQTPLSAMLKDPAIKAWIDEMKKEPLEEIEKALERVDADMDDLGFPEGMAGAALWVEELDPERGPDWRWVFAADFGGRAERFNEIIVEALEQGAEDEEFGLFDEKRDGVKVYTIEFATDEELAEQAKEWRDQMEQWQREWREDMDEEEAQFLDDEDWEIGDPPPPGPFDPQRVYYAMSGSTVIFSSGLRGADRALDALAGEKMKSLASEQADYAAARAQLDEIGAEMYAVGLAEPLKDLIDEAMEMLPVGIEAPDMEAMFEALGVMALRSLSVTGRFDTGKSMYEYRVISRLAEKKGIMGLTDLDPVAFRAPAFVGADASSYTMVQVDFSGIMATVQDFIAALPQDQQGQAGMMAGMLGGPLGALFDAIGPDVHIASWHERPFSATSQKQLFAIRLKDADAMRMSLQQLAPFIGLAPRDFDGNEIWESAQGAIPISLGIGFGNVFIGEIENVENAMRLAGADDAPRLDGEPRFKIAKHAVDDKAIGYSYADMRTQIEYALWTVKNAKEIRRQQMQEWLDQLDPEMREQFEDQFEDDAEEDEWSKMLAKAPPAEVFLKYLGDVVSVIRSNDGGYEMVTHVLAPASN